MRLEKHKFNIFPEMNGEDYSRLLEDIRANGYDETQPIKTYDSKILDGWNRYKACLELDEDPIIEEFTGDDIEAIKYVMRTNKRRNLNSGQWACIAIESEDIVRTIKEAVERERRQKIAEQMTANSNASKDKQTCQKIDTSVSTPERTDNNIATIFNTNRQYVSEASRLKQQSPITYEQVKSGQKTFSEVKKEQKQEKLREVTAQRKENDGNHSNNRAVISQIDAIEFLHQLPDKSVDLLITDPPFSTDIKDIESFANSWLPLAIDKMKDTARAYICIGAYPQEIAAYFNLLQKQSRFIVDSPLIWTYRNTLGITPKMKYNLNYQIIIHLYSAASTPLDTSITNEMFSVQDINAPDGRIGDRYHKWQKPTELARRLIVHSTKELDTIIDPFAGSGTFLVEAAKLNRIATGSEIDSTAIQTATERGCIIAGKKTSKTA